MDYGVRNTPMTLKNEQVIVLDGGDGMGSGILPHYPTAHTTTSIQNNHLFVVHSHRSIS